MTNEELRQIYGEMGLTQPEMADLMGISSVAFKRYVVKTSYQREIPPYIARFAKLLLNQFRAGKLEAYREMAEKEPLRKRASQQKKTLPATVLASKTAAARPEKGAGPGGASSESRIMVKPSTLPLKTALSTPNESRETLFKKST